ncbi:MAG: FHA domain-containing protein [Lachnospiraceae bacterium]|nr:FHA domain-containing protein [Lachnospiraceae bacterium]
MKKVSFIARNFGKERYLTYDIAADAVFDEEVLDFLEEEEPKGLVPIIYEESEEKETFSYDVTDKIRLCELSGQEINAEMVLKVMRGIVLSLIDMGEYRVSLSYLVMNRNYIYINSEYEVEFICIPLEDMADEADVNSFLRSFMANLRYESSENGDYVAKLLSYINNSAIFNLRNLLTLIEDLMGDYGIELPEDSSSDIYVDYQEIFDDDDDEDDEAFMAATASPEVSEPSAEEAITEESKIEEEESVVEEPEAEAEEPIAEEPEAEEEEPVAEEPEAEAEESIAEEPEAEEEAPVAEESEAEEEEPIVEEPEAEAEEPIAEEPEAEEEEPVAEEPEAEEEEPIAEEPEAEEEEPVAEEPEAEEEAPVAEEPAVEKKEPVAEEPAVEEKELVAEEPVVEKKEPVAEEPAVEEKELVAEEPAVEEKEPVAEEPAVEEKEPVAEEPEKEEKEPVAEEPEKEEEELVAEEPEKEEEELVAEKPMAEVEKTKETAIEKSEMHSSLEEAQKIQEAIALKAVTEVPLEKPKVKFKTKEADMPTVSLDYELDEYLAEREREVHVAKYEESGIKIRKNVKVNRASIVKSNQEEVSIEEAVVEAATTVLRPEDAPVSFGMTVEPIKTTKPPKANPYLIRVNTEERIMITKQNFKVGKASMGVDYTVKGNGAVSRVHAIISSKEDVYYIKDNKSTNHTVVNGRRLEEGEIEQLTNDCKIMMGNEEFVFKLG